MQICSRCVLPENFPGIEFDDQGVCSFCRSQKQKESRQAMREKNERKFLKLIGEHRGRSSYDCLVAYSGGKDSTYTLHLLKERYEMRALALSYDNWFQSEKALQNIRTLVKQLRVDHITILPRFDVLERILHAVVTHNIYSRKALERASCICTTCITLIRFACFQVAIEKDIPFVVFGMSPGQAPLSTAVVKTNAQMVRRTQEAILQPLRPHVGNHLNAYFLEERHFQHAERFPYSINPLAFMEYDEEAIFRTVQSLGWVKPDDTDRNSTNCLINSLANQVHLDTFGYNPYASELAELVREGVMERKVALKRLNQPQCTKTIEGVKRALGWE